EPLVIDVNAMFALGPFVTTASAAPGFDEIASRVEDHHGRRRHRRQIGLERSRTMQQPDVVLSVDRKTGGIAQLPLRWHLRPRPIDFERRKPGLALSGLYAARCAKAPEGARTDDDDCGQDCAASFG